MRKVDAGETLVNNVNTTSYVLIKILFFWDYDRENFI